MKPLFAGLTKKTGQHYEAVALRFLEKQGVRLIQRNYLTRYGEIDLIMEDEQQCLLFVEVRFRSSERFGGAAASVTPSKQRKLIKAAQLYINTHLIEQAMRFDVIAISPAANEQHEIQWLKNAFDEF